MSDKLAEKFDMKRTMDLNMEPTPKDGTVKISLAEEPEKGTGHPSNTCVVPQSVVVSEDIGVAVNDVEKDYNTENVYVMDSGKPVALDVYVSGCKEGDKITVYWNKGDEER